MYSSKVATAFDMYCAVNEEGFETTTGDAVSYGQINNSDDSEFDNII